MTDQPHSHAEPPGVVLAVDVRVSTLRVEHRSGGSAREGVPDRLVIHVDVEDRDDLDLADADRLVWHAPEPITRVPSERSGVDGAPPGGTMTARLRATARAIALCALAMLMTGCIKVDL